MENKNLTPDQGSTLKKMVQDNFSGKILKLQISNL